MTAETADPTGTGAMKTEGDADGVRAIAIDADTLVYLAIGAKKTGAFAGRSAALAKSATGGAAKAGKFAIKSTGRTLRALQDRIAQQAAFDEINERLAQMTGIVCIQHARISSLEERLRCMEGANGDG